MRATTAPSPRVRTSALLCPAHSHLQRTASARSAAASDRADRLRRSARSESAASLNTSKRYLTGNRPSLRRFPPGQTLRTRYMRNRGA